MPARWGAFRVAAPAPVVHIRTMGDPLAGADSATRVLTLARPLAEALGIIDDQIMPGRRFPADRLGITDTAGQGGASLRPALDTLALADLASPQLFVPGAFTRTVTDPLGITDPAAGVDLMETLVDALGLSHPAPGTLLSNEIPRSAGDPLGLTDATLRQGRAIVGVERIDLTDANLAAAYTETVTDPLGITDGPAPALSGPGTRALTDPLGIADAPVPELSGPGTRTLTDRMSITDPNARQTHQLVGVEQLGLTDTADLADRETDTEPITE